MKFKDLWPVRNLNFGKNLFLSRPGRDVYYVDMVMGTKTTKQGIFDMKLGISEINRSA